MASLQKFDKGGLRKRTMEKKTLHFTATQFEKQITLLGCFYTLGNNIELQTAGHGNNGLNN